MDIVLYLLMGLLGCLFPAAIFYVAVIEPGKRDKKERETVKGLCKFNDNAPHLENVEENYAKANIKNGPWVKIDEDIKEPVCQKVSEEVNTSTNQNNNDNELTM